MSIKRSAPIWKNLALPALILVPAFAWASAGCGPDPEFNEEGPAVDAASSAGQTVFIDPDTGELTDPPVPSPEDAAQQAQQRVPEGEVPVVELRDGTMQADPGDRFISELRVEIIDGEVVTCHRPVSPGADAATSQDSRLNRAHDDTDDRTDGA